MNAPRIKQALNDMCSQVVAGPVDVVKERVWTTAICNRRCLMNVIYSIMTVRTYVFGVTVAKMEQSTYWEVDSRLLCQEIPSLGDIISMW